MSGRTGPERDCGKNGISSQNLHLAVSGAAESPYALTGAACLGLHSPDAFARNASIVVRHSLGNSRNQVTTVFLILTGTIRER